MLASGETVPENGGTDEKEKKKKRKNEKENAKMLKIATKKKKRDKMQDRDNVNYQNSEKRESENQELAGDEVHEDGEIKKRMMTTEKRRNCKNGLSSPSSFHLPHHISPNFPCNIKQLLFFSGDKLR
uniref:Uncharacterized protein n=1 Tax=Solanum lycopersicum TaxID=4081 RepID=A0A3Q7GUW1_SOLLC